MMDRYNFILQVIGEAGERLLKYSSEQLEVSFKSGDPGDLITKADMELSEFISSKIKQAFPTEIIYSEESPDVDLSSGSFWSIDPIDGTTNFSRGIPHYAVVISFVESGVPIVGALYNPVTNELYSFEKGRGAFLNNKAVRVSDKKDLSGSFILLRIGRNKDLWDWGLGIRKFLLLNGVKCGDLGSSGLDICFVGSGKVEASIYGTLTTIDIAAAIGFLKEAGGLLVGREGQELSSLSKTRQSTIMVNNKELLDILRPALRN